LPIRLTNTEVGSFYNAMLPKPVMCIAAAAFAVSVVFPTGGAIGGRGGAPMQGTWNWPPYAGTEGGMSGKNTCGYVWANPDPHTPRGRGRWVYECR
jgi:hypothetical protein